MSKAPSRRWRSRKILGIGEAMVEFAPIGDNVYRRGFAGDTLNTCWHIAQLLDDRAVVGYGTRIGGDDFSTQFLSFLRDSGLDVSHVLRDPKRSIGLYVISLNGAERNFSYWRETSAARGLAEDIDVLRASMREAALIHVSGITLAVIGAAGRRNLMLALSEARAGGAVVSFDPNVRLRLWTDVAELRAASLDMLTETDIALPSFDDEASVWGDADSDATLSRIAAFGVSEIAVKNGAGPVALRIGEHRHAVATPAVAEIRDTTGAGDAFNAGYLAARFSGLSPVESCSFAQSLAGAVVCCFGALAPLEALRPFRARLLAATMEGPARRPLS